MTSARINTADLLQKTNQPDTVLLDVRPIAAYNGWPLRGEYRGGHITGARSFPLEWTAKPRWFDLLTKKGIAPGQTVVVYGYTQSDSARMAELLAGSGFNSVFRYDGFAEWAADDNRPMDHLARYHRLVYPEWVQQLISGERPPTHDGRRFVVCHASYRYRQDYESGHIPGAIHMDTEALESSKDWNRRPADVLRVALTGMGIDCETTVVLYGRFSHPNNEDEYPGRMAGHLAAMRCAQILLYAGVEDIRILNGGMASWQSAGYEVTTEEGNVQAVTSFGTEVPARPDLIVDTPEAKQLLASSHGELVSVRSWEEFIGKVSGYNYIDEVGRIPGAIFGNCGSDAYHMENYRNHDHTIREHHEIARIWARDGITPDKHIAFYCGTGWRASEAFWNAYLMDWPRVSVYDGGWMEWSSDPGNPIETGVPEGQSPEWAL